ncbi:hypothetical protein Tco_0530026 [Tanacetum coccineum]
MLKKCPHHGFSPLHQTDTFYNGLNQSDQDSLNSAAGGNLLTRNNQEALTITENKSKVRTSRNKSQVSSSIGSSSQNDAITALTKQVEALNPHAAHLKMMLKNVNTKDSIPPEIDEGIFGPKGDIILLEKLLNNDSTKDLPPKELKNDEIKTTESSIEEPPNLELKDLPPHLEYAFLEGTSKLPVIIAKT